MSAPRTTTESWSDVPVDGDQTLIYGPRWSRLYLLPPAEALAPQFLRVVGLRDAARDAALADPVERIHRDRTHFTGTQIAPPPGWLVATYRALGVSRHVVSFRVAARAVRRIAHLMQRTRRDTARTDPDADLAPALDAVARTIHAVESRVSTPDCYPRALLTALLSLSTGRACTLLVGVLAPTRKMHAWCCVDGVLPYERMPEHYMYRPLWTLSLTP